MARPKRSVDLPVELTEACRLVRQLAEQLDSRSISRPSWVITHEQYLYWQEQVQADRKRAAALYVFLDKIETPVPSKEDCRQVMDLIELSECFGPQALETFRRLLKLT